MIDDLFPHIGELLVERILNEDMCFLARQLNIKESDIQSVHRQLALEFPRASIIFDGFSTLDLAVLLTNGTVFPIELKLGYSGLARASVNKMLVPCTVSKHTSENRVSGKVLSILNRNFDGELLDVIGHSSLSARIEGKDYPVTEEWGIIARKKVLSSWDKLPPNFNGLQACISIEELCSNYGEDKFNYLVNDVFSNVNFYNEWIEKHT